MAIQSTQGKWKIYQNLDDLQIGVQGSKDPKSCDNYRRVCLVTQGGYEIPDYDEAQANAALICDAVNNTSGSGIDPNAVPQILNALEKLHIVAHSICGIDAVKNVINNPGYGGKTLLEALDVALKAIKSAKLK